MNKIVIAFGFGIGFYTVHAQNVGIGTASPNPSAILDISSSNRGVLLPRITLSSLNTYSPIVSPPPASLIIFNDGSGGVSVPGFYWWDGSRWRLLLDSIATTGPIIGYGSPSNPVTIIPGSSPGQILKWDGNQWTLAADSAGDNWGTQVAITQSPIIGDGTGGNPIAIQSGTTTGDILIWNGTQWTIGQPGPSVGVAPLCGAPLTNFLPKWTGTRLCNSIIYDNGARVGIGTSVPQVRLHVYDSVPTTALAISAIHRPWLLLHQLSTAAGYSLGIEINSTDTLFKINYDRPIGTAYQSILTASNNGFVGIRLNTTPMAPLHIEMGNISAFLRVENPTIGKTLYMAFTDQVYTYTNPNGVVYFEVPGLETYMFGGHVTSDGDGTRSLGFSGRRWSEVWAVNGTIQTSTKSEKTSIMPLRYGLKEVRLLRPVSYRWAHFPDTLRHLGFLAEDVYRVIPEVVRFNEQGDSIKGMSYTELIPVLTLAIQELATKVEQLEKEITQLQNQINHTNAISTSER